MKLNEKYCLLPIKIEGLNVRSYISAECQALTLSDSCRVSKLAVFNCVPPQIVFVLFSFFLYFIYLFIFLSLSLSLYILT